MNLLVMKLRHSLLHLQLRSQFKTKQNLFHCWGMAELPEQSLLAPEVPGSLLLIVEKTKIKKKRPGKPLFGRC